MSDESKEEMSIRRERRLAKFLDNDNGHWSPPAKVKKAEWKKKRDELVLKKDQVTEAFIDQLQEKFIIWSKVDPSHMGQGVMDLTRMYLTRNVFLANTVFT
jgi:hypothetical protein